MAVALMENETRNSSFKGGRKMKKTLTIVGTAVLVAAVAFPVLAYGPGQGKGMGMGFTNAETLYCENILNLNTEQSSKLKELREQHQKELLPLRNELFSKRAEVRSLWPKADPGEATIKAKQKEITELENKLQEKMTEYRLECQKVLTPEQQAQLQSARPGVGFWHSANSRAGQ